MAAPPFDVHNALSGAHYSAAELSADGSQLYLLDQRLLPAEQQYLTLTDVAAVATAIRDMVVRGAPAIGITAAYGMVLAARGGLECDASSYRTRMRQAGDELCATRPTGANLAWAVSRCVEHAQKHAGETGRCRCEQMAELARQIHREDVASCRRMGAVGAEHFGEDVAVLTHCNAGALATGGYGTALGVIRAAAEAGKRVRVLASETRPYLQGARLTAWELHEDGIEVTVITDSMVAHCMQRGMVDAVVVGADRIAANGDVANKIGTYGHASLAKAHGIPFYVAAPWSTVDLATATGADIEIEERDARELSEIGKRRLVAAGARVYNPAFDVTPAPLVTAIFTERGAFAPAELGSVAADDALGDHTA